MENYFVRRTTLDDIDLPPILYRYRDCAKQVDLDIFNEGRLWFSAPEKFKDKWDCNIPYDDITKEEAFNKYYSDLKTMYPLRGKSYIEAKAWAEVIGGLWYDPVHQKKVEEKFSKDFNSRFGVLCLTEDSKNFRMWNEYANSLNGFCIGINIRLMYPKIGGGGGEMRYYTKDKKPVLKHFMPAEVQWDTLIYNKLEDYHWENEYRYHKTWERAVTDKERNMQVPATTFLELIIGENVDPIIRASLEQKAKVLNPNIKIYTAKNIGGSIVIS